ncbi:MAG: hypothetical protein ABRQ39_24550 [Candidatus Eremiobacterota bacterium]
MFISINFILYKFKKKQGVTFAEILVAIGLISIVIVVMIGTIIAGLEGIQKGSGYNYANIIARRYIENYKFMEYSSIPVAPNIITSESGFTVKTSIIENTYPSADTIKYKKITVTVSNDSKNQTKNVKVKMIIYLFSDYKK